MNNQTALKSGIWYTISNLLVKSMALITTPLFTRLLSKADYGAYNNYVSWQGISVIFVTLNLEASLISAKFDYKDKFNQYILSILSLSMISALIWITICNIFMQPISKFLGMKPEYINLMLIYCGFFAAVNIFQISERYTYKYKSSVLTALFIAVSTTLISLVLVLNMKDKLLGRTLGGIMPTVVIGLVLCIHIVRREKAIDVSTWGYALKVCVPYIPHLLSLTMLNSIDRVMITRICGDESNALYSVAYSCGAMVTILLTSMNSAFSPWLGDKLHSRQFEDIRKVSGIYIWAFCYIVIGIMICAPEVLLIMGGSQYIEAKYVMTPVAMGCVCQFLYTMFVNIEQYEKRTAGMAFASMAAAVFNFILNAMFIPVFGYTAAAYTTLAGYLFLLSAHMILVKKMGFSQVYSYRQVLTAVSGMLSVTAAVSFLYMDNRMRAAAMLLYVISLAVAAAKNKVFVLETVKKFIKKG